MRSEVFNQIKKNRENYFRDQANQFVSVHKSNSQKAVHQPLKLPKLKLPRNLQLNGNSLQLKANVLYKIGASLLIGSQNLLPQFGSVLKQQLKPIKTWLQNQSKAIELKSENYKERFYQHVAGLFEDEGNQMSFVDNHSRVKAGNQTLSLHTNGVIERLRRMWASFLISLELDDAILEINPNVKQQTQRSASKPANKPPGKSGLLKKVFRRWSSRLLIVTKKVHHQTLKPVFNYFIL